MKLVDKSLNIPLHVQLSQIIREMIENKELEEGSYLMSERDLCKIQNISRMTVNKAIINLVNEGLLDRRQGKGTFVAYKKNKLRYQKMQGFTEIMENKKLDVFNKILKFRLNKGNNKVREKLNAQESNLVYEIERIRYINEDPTILEKVYILDNMCPSLSKDLVENNSLYKLYRDKYKHNIKRAEQVITPILLSKSECKVLNVDTNTLALKIDRIVYTEKEEIMEFTSSLFITDKHQYEIVLNEN